MKRLAVVAVAALIAMLVAAGTASAAPAAPRLASFVYGWGALAMSPSTGRVAYANDYPSADAAARAAVSRCGIRDCQALVQVADGCASMAQAPNLRLGWAWGASRGDSDGLARRYAGSGARIIAWVCTTGHR